MGISIDDLHWQEVGIHAMEISICNRTISTQFRIVHRTHITPALNNKMDANASPLCYKCNFETGNYIHCFWSCVKLQSYWSGIVNEQCAIFGVPLELDLMCILLGLPDGHINIKHKRLFKLLTFAAWKNILLFGIKEAVPTKRLWHNLIMECIRNEYISCMLQSSVDAFYKVWDPYFAYIGPTLSPSILQEFPKPA